MTTPTPGTVKVQASVSGYDGDSGTLTMWMEYKDDLGNIRRQNMSNAVSAGADGKKKCTITMTETGMLANTTYSITVWIQEESIYDSKVFHYQEETRKITMPAGAIAAGNVTLSVTENADTAINYSVTVSGNKQAVTGVLYYREKGYVPWGNSKNISLSSSQTTTSGTITGLKKGMEYEFKLVIDSLGIV